MHVHIFCSAGRLTVNYAVYLKLVIIQNYLHGNSVVVALNCMHRSVTMCNGALLAYTRCGEELSEFCHFVGESSKGPHILKSIS